MQIVAKYFFYFLRFILKKRKNFIELNEKFYFPYFTGCVRTYKMNENAHLMNIKNRFQVMGIFYVAALTYQSFREEKFNQKISSVKFN